MAELLAILVITILMCRIFIYFCRLSTGWALWITRWSRPATGVLLFGKDLVTNEFMIVSCMYSVRYTNVFSLFFFEQVIFVVLNEQLNTERESEFSKGGIKTSCSLLQHTSTHEILIARMPRQSLKEEAKSTRSYLAINILYAKCNANVVRNMNACSLFITVYIPECSINLIS